MGLKNECSYVAKIERLANEKSRSRALKKELAQGKTEIASLKKAQARIRELEEEVTRLRAELAASTKPTAKAPRHMTGGTS